MLTLDPARPHATAVAISGGRIAGVFDEPAGVPADRVIDLRGATVLPGFHDAHNHMAWFGMSLGEIDLRFPAVSSLDELYAAVAGRARRAAPGGWVVGSGYDQNKIGAHPDRDALDRAAPGARVWLRHTSGHMCVVSSAVLADLGLDSAAVPVPGGRVAVDAAGRPTGLLEETAQQLVSGLVHPYPVATLADAIDRAGQQYLAEGITSVTEAGIGGGWIGRSPVELAAYQAARDQGRLGVRVELMVGPRCPARAGRPRRRRPGAGARPGHPHRLRRRLAAAGRGQGVHRRLPGRAHRRDARRLRRHARAIDGYLQADAGELRAAIIAAHRSGWQVAAHAIGDGPSTWSSTPARRPRPGTRAPTRGTASSTSPRPAPTRSAGPRSSAWSRCRRAGSPASSATACWPRSARSGTRGCTGSARCWRPG